MYVGYIFWTWEQLSIKYFTQTQEISHVFIGIILIKS